MWKRILICAVLGWQCSRGSEQVPLAEVEKAIVKGIEFFRSSAGAEGTYLWQYSEDLAKREGEGKATVLQGWVQPPGTPAVGLAYLKAWRATGNPKCLEAARETAYALLRGQLRSGGWAHSMELDAKARKKHAYLEGGSEQGRNVTTFDDDSTQAAVRFLVEMDQALKFEEAKIHQAVQHALKSIAKAQYPNGSWPQGYDKFPNPEEYPTRKARYPESWSRTWPGSKQYWLRYTLNDDLLPTMVETLFAAERVYEKSKSPELAVMARKAAEKAGDFLLLAQMPEPQPAWAQQYDLEMQPDWARKFEPPAVTGGESQGAIRTLLKLYAQTAERRYLQPIPSALAYLRRSRLGDGRLARFYELRSNKPLYFTREYALTYDDSDMPTHYGFKVSDQTEQLEEEYQRLSKLSGEELRKETEERAPVPSEKLAREVREIIKAQDAQGRWVEEGRLRYHGPNDETTRVIRSATFIRNVEVLSRYAAALKGEKKR